MNEDIIQILNDPGVPLGIPQRLKSLSTPTPFAAARKLEREQRASLPVNLSRSVLQVEPQHQALPVTATPCPAELNMQNLAIHQTLMNEASAMTAKQQIMRNYMILTDKEATSTSREI